MLHILHVSDFIPTSIMHAMFLWFDVKKPLIYQTPYSKHETHAGFAMLTSNRPIPHAVKNTAIMPAKIVIGFR